MRHHTVFITAILAFSSSVLSAQVDATSHANYMTVTTRNMETYDIETIDGVSTMYYDNPAANIQGSPYLQKEFEEGTMTVLNGTVIPGLRYRYDIYGDKMLFIINGDTATINKPLALRSIEIGGKKFVYEVYVSGPDKVATGYFEVVEESESLTLLHRRQAELDQDVYVSNYGGGGGTKEFRMKTVDSYYLKLGKEAASKINSRKELLELFPDNQQQIREYMKQNRLKVKKEEDLRSIIQYCGRLLGADS
jgi:hypothetical protein